MLSALYAIARPSDGWIGQKGRYPYPSFLQVSFIQKF